MKNYFEMKLKAISENEKFARNTVASFLIPLNPTLSEIDDIKTAVSEAVTNCVVHGYQYDENGIIDIKVEIEDFTATITIADSGVGIENVEQAMTPFFTTKPEDDRSGMGFTLMQSFVDKIEVYSTPQKGTMVVMVKKIKNEGNDA